MNIEMPKIKENNNESAIQEVRDIKKAIMGVWKNNRQRIQSDRIAVDMFASELRKKYPDYYHYKLFHELSWGGIQPAEKSEKVDFPGEDSILTFFQNLYKEMYQDVKKAA